MGVYLDTCIWLNIFKKEPIFWKSSLKLLNKLKKDNITIYVSTIILKEIYFTYPKYFNKIKTYFKNNPSIKIIKTKNVDYNLARKYETKDKSKISFYDYLHIAISKRLKSKFITRDIDLISFAENEIEIISPEKLIS